MPNEKKSLVTKLSEIMRSVERIPKNGFNAHFQYKYATEADVADHCREFLADHHVLMTADVESTEQLGDVCRMHIRFTFHDGDSDEKISFVHIADGQDKQDKAPYKALTGAVKYALMKTFLIPTGDDPERDEPATKAKKQEPEKLPNAQDTKLDWTAPATEAQRKKLYAKIREAGIPDADIPGLLSAIAGRTIASSSELTKGDASKAIDVLCAPLELKKHWPPVSAAEDKPYTQDDGLPF